MARCTSAYFLKAFDEVAHILKAAFVSCRIDGLAHHQQFAGAVYAYALDVLDVVQPSLLLEPFAEIVLAKAHHCGGGIQGDAAGVVFMRPGNERSEFLFGTGEALDAAVRRSDMARDDFDDAQYRNIALKTLSSFSKSTFISARISL